MCMEDIKIGRETYTAVTAVALANGADTPLVATNADRISLAISTGGGNARIQPAGAPAVTDAAFLVGATLPPLLFHVDIIGDAVTKAWSGSGVAGAVTVLVIEGFLGKRQ